MIDKREQTLLKIHKVIQKICGRFLGAGFNQLILLSSLRNKEANVFMKIYNFDTRRDGPCGTITSPIDLAFLVILKSTSLESKKSH
jgi:diaminopimelate epimerase